MSHPLQGVMRGVQHHVSAAMGEVRVSPPTGSDEGCAASCDCGVVVNGVAVGRVHGDYGVWSAGPMQCAGLATNYIAEQWRKHHHQPSGSALAKTP